MEVFMGLSNSVFQSDFISISDVMLFKLLERMNSFKWFDPLSIIPLKLFIYISQCKTLIAFHVFRILPFAYQAFQVRFFLMRIICMICESMCISFVMRMYFNLFKCLIIIIVGLGLIKDVKEFIFQSLSQSLIIFL